MNTKTKSNFLYIPMVLAVFMILSSGLLKLIGPADLINHYAGLNAVKYIKLFGAMEIAFILLLIYPPTIKIGLLLITAYFGGAIATELTHGNGIVFPMMILVIVWIAVAVKNPFVFIGK